MAKTIEEITLLGNPVYVARLVGQDAKDEWETNIHLDPSKDLGWNLKHMAERIEELGYCVWEGVDLFAQVNVAERMKDCPSLMEVIHDAGIPIVDSH